MQKKQGMKPNKRAVRCADEELAENDPQTLGKWLDLEQEQERNAPQPVHRHESRQGQRQTENRTPTDARSAAGEAGSDNVARQEPLSEKMTADDHAAENRSQEGRSSQGGNPQTARESDATGIGTVTQITPDDILAEEGPIAPRVRGGTVTAEEVEQDVVTLNPSVESMESRG